MVLTRLLPTWVSLGALVSVVGAPGPLRAQPPEPATAHEHPADAPPPQAEERPPARPTIQRRYAAKLYHFYLHAGGTTHVRDDFYDVWGGTLHGGFYVSESLALEFGAAWLASTLNDAAVQLRNDSGLVPDARPQEWLLQGGARYSLGYAKALLLDALLSHFDPQVFALAGVARAEEHWVPTLTIGFGLLVHLPLGIQALVDFGFIAQIEERTDRGWIPGFGFMPRVSAGWAVDIPALFEGES